MTSAEEKTEFHEGNANLDPATVAGFGDEWSRFTQDRLDDDARERIFQDYFAVFPWGVLPPNAVGADVGCGSGRWAQLVAPRVGGLILIDASPDALAVARHNLIGVPNVHFQHASIGALPMADASLDFAYSLGVLHHVPDTAAAIRAITAKLKPGAPFLIYLYYAFDNRGVSYRTLWRISDLVRRGVSRLPFALRYPASQILATLVYWPLARTARVLERLGALPGSWPLAYYRDKPFYVLRTDALDRFGTRLEQRFSRAEIHAMLSDAGYVDIRFSERAPYWCAVGIKG
ncbi:MAG: class I SAM-dependent methyltransferase [Burkholderiales bacterium]|nr:class I SAM-dependent methyltransferase [Burkholderiales bacterium]